MTRMTRQKAAEVAEQLHVDEDALLDIPDDMTSAKLKDSTPEPSDRSPLGEIAPNSAESKNQSDDGAQELRKSTRGRKAGKKGVKGKKDNLAASTACQPEIIDVSGADQVLQDAYESTPSPASETAAEHLLQEVPECK